MGSYEYYLVKCNNCGKKADLSRTRVLALMENVRIAADPCKNAWSAKKSSIEHGNDQYHRGVLIIAPPPFSKIILFSVPIALIYRE